MNHVDGIACISSSSENSALHFIATEGNIDVFKRAQLG